MAAYIAELPDEQSIWSFSDICYFKRLPINTMGSRLFSMLQVTSVLQFFDEPNSASSSQGNWAINPHLVSPQIAPRAFSEVISCATGHCQIYNSEFFYPRFLGMK